MKKNRLRIAFLLLAAAVAVASCAQKEEVAYDVLEQRSLDAWMKTYAPTAERLANGMYLEVVEPAAPGAAEPRAEDWVRLDFTGTDLWGNVFVTRSDTMAAWQGTRTLYTCYEPLYTQLRWENYSITQAQIAAMLTYKMKEGEVVRIYFPSWLGYGTTGSSYAYGYQGQTALGASVPAIITMELTAIIPDPVQYEENSVDNHAAVLGLRTPTMKNGDSLLYAKILRRDLDTLAPKVTQESEVELYYIGRFLDGFVFDTNIDSVWQRVRNDNTAKDTLLYTPSEGGLVAAFQKVFDAKLSDGDSIRYGDWVRMFFTSSLGYGAAGVYPSSTSTAATVIQPYTPLEFEFFVEKP